MTEQETSENASATPEHEAPIPFKQFLEAVHPSVQKDVSGLGSMRDTSVGSRLIDMNTPELRLHCQRCEGERTFRSEDSHTLSKKGSNGIFVRYLCGDCRKHQKLFSLLIMIKQTPSVGVAYKYGELPPFGPPVPNKLLRLFGEDRDNFIKGRQCENQSLGVGAFAYYRRVVENHKDEIFDEIIKVCETVGASEELIEELTSAKKEIKFTEAMKRIKFALPDGLLINGHNPLLLLHAALSIGLHDESDAKCLEAAHDVRLVLTDLIEKMSLLRTENSELHSAVQRLIAKKGGA